MSFPKVFNRIISQFSTPNDPEHKNQLICNMDMIRKLVELPTNMGINVFGVHARLYQVPLTSHPFLSGERPTSLMSSYKGFGQNEKRRKWIGFSKLSRLTPLVSIIRGTS